MEWVRACSTLAAQRLSTESTAHAASLSATQRQSHWMQPQANKQASIAASMEWGACRRHWLPRAPYGQLRPLTWSPKKPIYSPALPEAK
eukprot:5348920-Pleurochrysis_carterae.AAC.2